MSHLPLACVCIVSALEAQQWLPVDVGSLGGHALDTRRQRVVLLSDLSRDLWELDGTSWLFRATMAGFPEPVARQGASVVFDPSREHLLLFGGRDPSVRFGDTWIRVDDRWTLLPSATSPSPREDAAVVFDPLRDCVLMFGGKGQTYGNETWQHDGSQWTQLSPLNQPPAGPASMVFDVARGVVVLAVVPFVPSPPEIWEWDGSDWQLRVAVGNRPSPRLETSFVHDPVRQRSVLLGGDSGGGEIWEWDGVGWTQQGTALELRDARPLGWFDANLGKVVVLRRQVPAAEAGRYGLWAWDGNALTLLSDARAPNPRTDSLWLFDTTSDSVLLFGGTNGVGLGDTWRWDGVRWRFEQAVPSPSGRHSAAFTGGAGAVGGFLFGGLVSGFAQDDFWRWTASGWTQVTTANGPSARLGASMAYDESRNRVVLFGGLAGSALLADTWEFDGSQWSLRPTAGAPPPRHQAAMTYDVVRGRSVLFGGVGLAYWTDTWEWDGTQWSQSFPLTVPVPTLSRSMTYDRDRHRCVMSAHWGVTSNDTRDLWEYDGVDWVLVDRRPTLSSHTVVAYDQARGRLMGYDGISPIEWTATPALVAELGGGCGQPAWQLAARQRPRLGQESFGLEAFVAANSAVLFGLSGSGGAPSQPTGCGFTVGPLLASSLVFADASGLAEQSVPLPLVPALRGTTWYAQAAALSPTGGFSLGRGLAFTVGD